VDIDIDIDTDVDVCVCVCVCVCVRVYVGISIYTVVMRHIERDARKAGKRSFYKTASDGYV